MRIFTLLLLAMLSTHTLANTFKIATLSPEGSFWMVEMRKAADSIAQKTDNRVKFRFYPGGVMGNDAAVLRKIRVGQLQGAALSGGTLARQAPDTQIYNIPLLFNSYAEVDHVRKHMDGEMEQAFEKAGFVNFGLAEGGFAYIMSKNPIATTDELTRQKIWAPSDDSAAQAAAETFNFSPTPLSLGDVLTGLQTDLINTVTTSPVAAIALQWHTQIKHITDLPLAYFYALMVIDQKAFAKVDAADQKIVRDIMRQAFVNIGQQNRKDNDSAFSVLRDQGINMITPNEQQLAQWYTMTRSASGLFVDKAGINKSLLTRIEQLLAEYRKQHAE